MNESGWGKDKYHLSKPPYEPIHVPLSETDPNLAFNPLQPGVDYIDSKVIKFHTQTILEFHKTS